MFTIKTEYFDLKKIMESGQVFRFYETAPGEYTVYSGNRCLELKQNGSEVTFMCDKKEYEEYWEDYFDLKRDYGNIVAKAGSMDDGNGARFLSDSCSYASDIRILKQNVWEMMISFIISQQKQIPSIRKCIEALCERFGERHEEPVSKGSRKTQKQNTVNVWYGFPTAASIASKGPEGLKGLSLGYRERYIYETAVKYMTEGFDGDSLRKMGYDEAKKTLCTFSGIGEKVADCVCLFGCGYTDAFPIDVHIKDILYREFFPEKEKEDIEKALKIKLSTTEPPRKKLLDSISYARYTKIIDEAFSAFKGVRGIVQQWIFAYELHRGIQ
jgi:N-glycosylase/DNA lyase